MLFEIALLQFNEHQLNEARSFLGSFYFSLFIYFCLYQLLIRVFVEQEKIFLIIMIKKSIHL